MEYFLSHQDGITKMSQSPGIPATTDGELVSPQKTQDGRNTCLLAAIRLQPFPMVIPKGDQDVKKQDTGPR